MGLFLRFMRTFAYIHRKIQSNRQYFNLILILRGNWDDNIGFMLFLGRDWVINWRVQFLILFCLLFFLFYLFYLIYLFFSFDQRFALHLWGFYYWISFWIPQLYLLGHLFLLDYLLLDDYLFIWLIKYILLFIVLYLTMSLSSLFHVINLIDVIIRYLYSYIIIIVFITTILR